MRGIAIGFLALVAVAGCGREPIERVEWTTMGTVAACQVRGTDATGQAAAVRPSVQKTFSAIEHLLNAHDATSEISQLAPLGEDEILKRASSAVRSCYAAAFAIARTSGGAFNPRWRGPGTLDLGAIAKGFAVDVAAAACATNDIAGDVLIDLGGNLKSVSGSWKVGVRNPAGEGCADEIVLESGEALATSATYFRGRHIYDGRTGKPVSNGVASVTVKAKSAMWADALSTTLYVLGPDEGLMFLRRLEKTVDVSDVSALWIMDDGKTIATPRGRDATSRSRK